MPQASRVAPGTLLLLSLLLISACESSDLPGAETGAHAAERPASLADTLVASEDFESIEVEGFAPYYRDARWESVAVNSIEWPDRFAAAEASWRGDAGLYDLTLVTITEQDGESSYRLSVSGESIGEVQNPAGADYELSEHIWGGVQLNPGDVLQVASNSHSNMTVPEGDGFATSRGRWRYLIIEPHR